MRFLADMGVSSSTVQRLRAEGHDAVHLREEGLHRSSDSAIFEKARIEKRIVLTFDLDFGDLLATGRHAFPSVVIFRVQDQTPASIIPKLLEIIQSRHQQLETGAIVIVEDSRHRIRRLPLRTTEEAQETD